MDDDILVPISWFERLIELQTLVEDPNNSDQQRIEWVSHLMGYISSATIIISHGRRKKER